MKKLSTFTIVPGLAALCLTAGVAHGGTTGLGANCVENWPYSDGLTYLGAAVAHNKYNGSTSVTCPVDSDHDVGGAADFKVAVRDYDQDRELSCYGIAYDSNGNAQGTSPTKYTSGSSGSLQNLTMSISGYNPTSSWSFGVICTIPSYPSGITTVRVY